jgi:hypothetical protein
MILLVFQYSLVYPAVLTNDEFPGIIRGKEALLNRCAKSMRQLARCQDGTYEKKDSLS